ncbi:hypothetical protein MNBD_NITROSPINAE03-869 [hydrothermal vent metagenome]|uniref:Type II secretion system protein GspN n=1 Tax=hydrothermal vent metagenome TaxID=652676 RepID=A0A3B1CUV1_9ZZZZ
MKTSQILSLIVSRPRPSKTAGYSLFFIAALVTLTYIRFPVGVVGEMIENAFLKTPVNARIGSVSLSFPPGLAFENVTISDRSPANNQLLNIKRVKIRPSILSAITGDRRVFLSAQIMDGDASAVVDFSGGKGDEINVDIRFSGINTGAGRWWDTTGWGSLDANLNGEGSFSLADPNVVKGEGRIKIVLEKGLLKFKKELGVKLPDIAIDSGELELDFKSRKLTITKARLTGPEFNAAITGDIYTALIPKFSRFNLTLKASIDKTLENKLGPIALLLPPEKGGVRSVRIGGTGVKPDFRFE